MYFLANMYKLQKKFFRIPIHYSVNVLFLNVCSVKITVSGKKSSFGDFLVSTVGPNNVSTESFDLCLKFISSSLDNFSPSNNTLISALQNVFAFKCVLKICFDGNAEGV